MRRTSDDWNTREDGRPATYGHPQTLASGERFWVLGVHLWASQRWPADAYARLLIWEAKDGTWHTESGRYWPHVEDDGA